MTPARPRFALLVCVLMHIIALLAGCKKDAADSKTQQGGGKRGARPLEFPVEVSKVVSKKVEYEVSAPGTIEAFESVRVTARVAGVIDRVAFVEGEVVKKGQVLVAIEAERYRLAASQAQAQVHKAEATVADVNAGLARREAATEGKPGLIPGEELETYRTKTRTAKADLDQAKEGLKVAQLNLRDSAVRAPIAGIIQTRTVETGQYVQPGTVLATLVRREPLLLRFQVTTLEAPRLKPGMKASFAIREAARPFEATITLVAAAADPTSHLVPVTAEVDAKQAEHWLRPGTFCDVDIHVGDAREKPVVPITAVRPSERGFLVYVIDGNVAHEKQVKLGMHTNDGQVEIREGLEAGETLVVRGAEPLSDGAKVRVVDPNAIPTARPPSSAGPPDAAPSGSAGRRRRGEGEGKGEGKGEGRGGGTP